MNEQKLGQQSRSELTNRMDKKCGGRKTSHAGNRRFKQSWRVCGLLFAAFALTAAAKAQTYSFSTGDPDGRMGTASRPGSGGLLEVESADDFNPTTAVSINQATFTGLLPVGLPLSDVNQVIVEIYRVFPSDSTFPPDNNVPTRANSPSDNAFLTRDSAAATLSFTTTLLSSSFTVANTVINGIFRKPLQTTLGEGPVTGQEVRFNLQFSSPLELSANHYFFVPQVKLSDGTFLWLSAPKPIMAPGTPFTPDLQTWIRNANLDPDWLRVGTDIVGGTVPPTFNAAFSLSGTVPDAGYTAGLLGFSMFVLANWPRRATVKK